MKHKIRWCTVCASRLYGILSPPEVAVPVATYTGWNLRRKQAGYLLAEDVERTLAVQRKRVAPLFDRIEASARGRKP